MPDPKIQINYVLDDDDDVASAAERAESAGLTLGPGPLQTGDPQLQFTGLELIAIGAGALLVVKFISSEIDRRKGGVVIDVAAEPKTIRRDRNLPVGYVVVYGADGNVQVDVHDAPQDFAERLLSTFISGVVGSSAQAAQAALDAGVSADSIKASGKP